MKNEERGPEFLNHAEKTNLEDRIMFGGFLKKFGAIRCNQVQLGAIIIEWGAPVASWRYSENFDSGADRRR